MKVTPAPGLPPLPPRPADSHKGTYGRVLLVAGSPGMAGAAILSARAALRGGAGLVTAAVPASLSAALAAVVPEATQLLLPEPAAREAAGRTRAALGEEGLSRFDTAAVGPGLGTSRVARELVAAVLAAPELAQVVDADALNLVALGVPAPPSARRIWTPHPGEFHRLTGESPRGDAERIEACERFVRARGGVVVLKGHRTVVLDASHYAVNLTGNPGMATGGAGDVLTGLLAALLAQGMEPFAAARLGVYLHGLAGDLAAKELSEPALAAGDLVRFLPRAFRSVLEGGGR